MRFKVRILYYLACLKLSKWLFSHNRNFLYRFRAGHLKNILKRSPFYRPLVLENKSLDEFPIMNKSLFMQGFNQINTQGLDLEQCMSNAIKAEESRDFSPMIGDISVGLSTGTSGSRGIFLASEKERAIWVASVLDRVIGFSFRKRTVAFFLRANNNLYQSARSPLLQFKYFDIFLPIEEQFTALNACNPNILVAQPSVLCMIAQAITEGQVQIDPEKIISVAEVLTEEDSTYLEQVFKQKIHQVYQCTEGFLAASCAHGTMHFNEDFLCIEKKYIDKERTRFHPLITDFLRETQPVVRYELNDIISELQNCPCGSPMMAIQSIEGRSDDILVFQDAIGTELRLFPDLFRRTIVLADKTVLDYCLIQSSAYQLNLYIKSDSKDAYTNVCLALEQLILGYGIAGVKIQPLTHDPQKQGQKKRRIKNETPKTH